MFKTKYRISMYELNGSRYFIPEYKYWFWPLWHKLQVVHQGGGTEPMKFTDIHEVREYVDDLKKAPDKPVMVGKEYR